MTGALVPFGSTSLVVQAPPVPVTVTTQLGYHDGWLVGAMPVVMQEDFLLTRFVSIFEEISSSVRYAVEKSVDVADVSVAPGPMLRYLGEWVQAPAMHDQLPIALQRRIVRASGETMAERGTAGALERLLAAVTGATATVHDSGGVFADGAAPIGPATVVVRISGTGHLSEAEVRKLVRAEVPAHIPVEVFLSDAIALPTTTPAEVAP
jgi:phage tail-like protein